MGLVWQRTLGASSDLPWVGGHESNLDGKYLPRWFFTEVYQRTNDPIDYVAGWQHLKTLDAMLLKIEVVKFTL
jgi:hypothetical protein